jgi:antiviral helicase SKI2
MPTKTAVFVGVKKYDELCQDMRILSTAEYLQMAGRAGRRGLDTMGTVIYLPDRNPIEPSEMRAMMCGGRAEVTSRMEFDYDFILKTIQSGNRTWLDILEKSYWRRQRQVQMDDIKAEQAKLGARLQQVKLASDEMEIIQQKVDLEQQIATLTNAKRKKAELQLLRWKDEYRGVKWEHALKGYDETQSILRTLAKFNRDLEILSDTSSDVERKIKVLEHAGFLKPLDDPKAHTKDSLTTVGVLATELNEADALLISQFYLTPRAKELAPEELLCVLAGCIMDGKTDNDTPLSDIKVPQIVKDCLYDLTEIWDNLRKVEVDQKSVASKWSMGSSWIGPMWDWINGNSVASICQTYGIYEGNLIRSVMKLQNMLDEWRSMAAFCEHTEMMDKFRDAHTLLLKEAVIQDSLYLHM